MESGGYPLYDRETVVLYFAVGYRFREPHPALAVVWNYSLTFRKLTSLAFLRFDTSQLRLIYGEVLLTLSYLSFTSWSLRGKEHSICWVRVMQLLNKFDAVFLEIRLGIRFVWRVGFLR